MSDRSRKLPGLRPPAAQEPLCSEIYENKILVLETRRIKSSNHGIGSPAQATPGNDGAAPELLIVTSGFPAQAVFHVSPCKGQCSRPGLPEAWEMETPGQDSSSCAEVALSPVGGWLR